MISLFIYKIEAAAHNIHHLISIRLSAHSGIRDMFVGIPSNRASSAERVSMSWYRYGISE